jgi:hypothetical protein
VVLEFVPECVPPKAGDVSSSKPRTRESRAVVPSSPVVTAPVVPFVHESSSSTFRASSNVPVAEEYSVCGTEVGHNV